MKIAALQMNSQPDLQHNLDQAAALVADAAAQGAGLIGLPENFAWLSEERLMAENVRAVGDAVRTALPAWAQKHGVYLLAGGYPVPAGGSSGKVFNRAELFAPDGGLVAAYNKMHLFDVIVSEEEKYLESAYVQAGEAEPVTARIEMRPGNTSIEKKHPFEKEKPAGLTLGLSVCYDLRFPELYRALVQQGADLLCVPAAFTKKTGEAHWHLLLRARAVENTAYVMAPAQAGLHGKKRETYGHAMIVNPWGEIIAEVTDGKPGAAIAEISPEFLAGTRSRLPCLKHRRIS